MEIKIIRDDFSQMASIEQAAYSASFKGTQEERKELEDIFKGLTENGDITAYGAYDKDLMGCVLHYDFKTNFHGKMIHTAGIGSLAVDLLHKKKRVANHLILNSIERAKEEGVMLYYLYPFNVKFYRNFGFGYGRPMYTYCVKPEDFKDMGHRDLLSYGTSTDYNQVIEFYNDYAKSKHGMSLKTSGDIKRLYRMKQGKLILAKDETGIIGYMIYTQKGISQSDNQAQKIIISEMLYTKRALSAFSSFFYAQKDQIDYIELATHDHRFHHILRDTCFASEPKTMEIIALKVADKAIGLMPLVLDPQALLDTLETKPHYELIFKINHPKAQSKDAIFGKGEKVNIELDINEFSSWITGVISLEDLYFKNLLKTDREDLLRHIDQQLYFESPISLTRF